MKKRCKWCESDDIYIKYHDVEWGVPVYDDKILFEFLILESFQAGLSWLTILKKRTNFKKAFDNFKVLKIANYDDEKVNELMNNEGIIRHQLKIESAIINANVFLKVQKEFGSFSSYIWKFTDYKAIKVINEDVEKAKELSDAISEDLKKRGMKFVGTTIIYSYLEAIGVLNNHEQDCFKHEERYDKNYKR